MRACACKIERKDAVSTHGASGREEEEEWFSLREAGPAALGGCVGFSLSLSLWCVSLLLLLCLLCFVPHLKDLIVIETVILHSYSK